jgi:catechol 2,3-dioxygenase-like lactoylglutathione lyase family enzyme
LTSVDVSSRVSIDSHQSKGVTVARVQLALNVSDLDEAVEFYSKLFKAAPAKRQSGYANFAIDEPPLKLVLIEGGGEPGSINHLGVEVFSTSEVAAATQYLTGVGFETDVEEQVTCCYAVQDKVWVKGPDGACWEFYTVLEDSKIAAVDDGDGGACCASGADTVVGATGVPSSCC